jgi:methionine aminotransferase
MEYSGNLNSKLPNVGTTIFTIMSKMAADHNAINLSQGFPDFDCDDELISLVVKHLKDSKNQYAPMAGLMKLREVLVHKIEDEYSAVYNPETEITITAGATQAIYTAITAIVRENDEVIVFDPAYDCYDPAIELNGGKAIHLKLKAPGYSVNWDEVKKVVNRKTRMIIINTPHNPTGAIFTAEDMSRLERITRGTDIIVLSDEVYEHIIFDGFEHQSVARFPKLAERSFIVSSFGKTFHATGWKMGYCIAPSNLMNEFRKVHQFIVFCVNAPIQYALADYLQNKKNYIGLSKFYQKKRDLFLKSIKGANFEFQPSKGTYFQLLNYKKITDEKDVDFAVRLTKEFKVASIPVSIFYSSKEDNHVLRFCFAKRDETIESAAAILKSI